MSNDQNKCPFHAPRFPDALRDVENDSTDGNTDLTVWAPIKEGFIDSFGNITYESRLRIVAEALNKLRKNVREFQLLEPFPDSTKRILSLLSFRIGIADRDLFGYGRSENKGTEEDKAGETLRPRKYMYLTATFDGPWEPYMRQIWKPLGTFLDIVLCNCDGYKPSHFTEYDEYIQWVRDHLLDTAMFYAVSGLTVKDNFYLESLERIHRETSDPDERDLQIAMLHTNTVEEEAIWDQEKDPSNAMKLGLEALNVLYQLTKFYPPDSKRNGDGIFLHKATRDILQDFDFRTKLEAQLNLKAEHADDESHPNHVFFKIYMGRCQRTGKLKKCRADWPKHVGRLNHIAQTILTNFKDQLDWYDIKYPKDGRIRIQHEEKIESSVQKGILTSYESNADDNPVTHGALLMLRIVDEEKIKNFLDPDLWSWEHSDNPNSIFFRNIAISKDGIKKLPLSEKEIRAFPKEFRQGAMERAAILGDTYNNHPQRWNLPKRNWTLEPELESEQLPPVHPEEIDLFVQLRVVPINSPPKTVEYEEFENIQESLFVGLFGLSNASGLLGSDNSSTSFNAGFSILDIPPEYKKVLFKLFFELLKINANTDLEKFFNDNVPDSEFEIGDDFYKTIISLYIFLLTIFGEEFGVEILSIQSTFRPGVTDKPKKNGTGKPIPEDHFGFRDGISQPELTEGLTYGNTSAVRCSKPMAVNYGDLVRGYDNLLGDYPNFEGPKKVQKNGSFVAFRKMRQNVGEFQMFLNKNCNSTAHQNVLAAKMMGRRRDGTPLIKSPDGPNAFRYDEDKDGKTCPFISHIRRANPRDIVHERKAPKIVRRGMTYGRKVGDITNQNTHQLTTLDSEDRGVMFMAYCSNLSEQYETVLRWVNGGNSSNTGSMRFDPILAPLPKSGESVFNLAEKNSSGKFSVNRYIRRTKSLKLPADDGSFAVIPPRPFVKLEWSAYGFAPSKIMLKDVIARLNGRKWRKDGDLIDQTERGRQILEEIENLPSDALKRKEWKALLEDVMMKDPANHDISRDVYKYIRTKLGGAYRIESGVKSRCSKENKQKAVLVTDNDLIKYVMKTPEIFSSYEIGARITEIFNENQIGMDPGPVYDREAEGTNAALFTMDYTTAFNDAYAIAHNLLERRKKLALEIGKANFSEERVFKIELVHEYFAPVLGHLCQLWFGLLDHDIFEPKGWAWDDVSGDDRAPRVPGDFFAASRGAFYPRPTQAIHDYAINHGKRLRDGIRELVAHWMQNGKAVNGKYTRKIWDEIGKLPDLSDEDKIDLLERNVIGSMIGMLPPAEATLRGLFFDWFDEGTLWRVQGHLTRELFIKNVQNPDFNIAHKTMGDEVVKSMTRRPAPDLLYRIAKHNGNIGDTYYEKGDIVILSLAGAMQGLEEDGADGQDILDVVFGGDRPIGPTNHGGNPHACPAIKSAMGSLYGIIAALLTSGTIQALPASLIVEISDWP